MKTVQCARGVWRSRLAAMVAELSVPKTPESYVFECGMCEVYLNLRKHTVDQGLEEF